MESQEENEEQLSLEDMERIILENPHVLRIEKDEDYLPPEIDYKSLSLGYEQRLRKVIGKLITFINKRYYIDDFGKMMIKEKYGCMKWIKYTNGFPE